MVVAREELTCRSYLCTRGLPYPAVQTSPPSFPVAYLGVELTAPPSFHPPTTPHPHVPGAQAWRGDDETRQSFPYPSPPIHVLPGAPCTDIIFVYSRSPPPVHVRTTCTLLCIQCTLYSIVVNAYSRVLLRELPGTSRYMPSTLIVHRRCD